MENIYKSASKIVFLTLTATACVGFGFGILGEDNFMLLAVAASSFYFSNKGTQDTEYLGK